MEQPPWWQRGVIYQIYPRSWMDSNGDGVGDLPGILARLDHLTWLGVDAVWISPVYPSPGADLGYDVAGYTAIHPLFGTRPQLAQPRGPVGDARHPAVLVGARGGRVPDRRALAAGRG
jgi:1,4-alpha-glucan branching enzyme